MSWLTGWSYRKEIVIAPSADGAQTAYQLKLLVGESAGATGEQVDCAGHALSSFDDLRFTTADGQTLCDYWIESITGSTPNQLATVWVKIPSIAASPADTTIYMYYGNSGASAASSGVNTFPLGFDDFERGVDGDPVGGSWTAALGTPEIDTGAFWGGTRSLRIKNGDSATIPVTHSNNIAIRFRYLKTDTCIIIFRHADGTTLAIWAFEADEDLSIYDGASYIDVGLNCLIAPNWGLLEMHDWDWSAKTVGATLDGNSVSDKDFSLANSSYANKFQLNAATNYFNLDDFLVRKWTSNEPAWGSFGSEELSPSSYHVILSAVYSEESPEVNRTFVVGSDPTGFDVSGSAVTQAEVDLVGERMDALHNPAIPTAAVAAAVASAMLEKSRLDQQRAELVIPPHCGLELWDVLAVVDTVANQDTLYRVSGYQLEYDTVKGAYFHRLQLCAV